MINKPIYIVREFKLYLIYRSVWLTFILFFLVFSTGYIGKLFAASITEANVSETARSVIVSDALETAVGGGSALLTKRFCSRHAVKASIYCGLSFGSVSTPVGGAIGAVVCGYGTYVGCTTMVSVSAKALVRTLRNNPAISKKQIREQASAAVNAYAYKEVVLFCKQQRKERNQCSENDAQKVYTASVQSVASGTYHESNLSDPKMLVESIDKIINEEDHINDGHVESSTKEKVQAQANIQLEKDLNHANVNSDVEREIDKTAELSEETTTTSETLQSTTTDSSAIFKALETQNNVKEFASSSLAYMHAAGELTLALSDSLNLSDDTKRIAMGAVEIGQSGLQIMELLSGDNSSPLAYMNAASIGINALNSVFGGHKQDPMASAIESIMRELHAIGEQLDRIEDNQKKILEALVTIDEQLTRLHNDSMQRFDIQDRALLEITNITHSQLRSNANACKIITENIFTILYKDHPFAEEPANLEIEHKLLLDPKTVHTLQIMESGRINEITAHAKQERLIDTRNDCLRAFAVMFSFRPQITPSTLYPFELNTNVIQLLQSTTDMTEQLERVKFLEDYDAKAIALLDFFSQTDGLSALSVEDKALLDRDVMSNIKDRGTEEQLVVAMVPAITDAELLNKMSIDKTNLGKATFDCRQNCRKVMTNGYDVKLFSQDLYHFITISHLISSLKVEPRGIFRSKAYYFDEVLESQTLNAIRWVDVLLAKESLRTGDVLLPILYGLLKHNIKGLETQRLAALHLIKYNPGLANNLVRYWVRRHFIDSYIPHPLNGVSAQKFFDTAVGSTFPALDSRLFGYTDTSFDNNGKKNLRFHHNNTFEITIPIPSSDEIFSNEYLPTENMLKLSLFRDTLVTRLAQIKSVGTR